MLAHSFLSFIALWGTFAQSSPFADPQAAPGTADANGTAIGGALDLPADRPAAADANDAAAVARRGPMTVRVVNHHGSAITTSFRANPGVPTPVQGQLGEGKIAAGATAHVAVPTGFGGTVFMADASHNLNTNSDSQVEFSFQVPADHPGTPAVEDVDVSYVTGFSIPITCSCGGNVVTGCNKDLFKHGHCANPDNGHTCANPLRGDKQATSAAPFFAPCMHGAYTYPNDGASNSYNDCQGKTITCCVGTACPHDPKTNGDPNKRSIEA